jgi:hypothetical protein
MWDGFTEELELLGAGMLALAVPDYACRFSTAVGRSCLVWELPVQLTVAGGSMAIGVSGAAAYFAGDGQAVGKLDLRYWTLFIAGHRVDLGLAAGGFVGDGVGQPAEPHLRFHSLDFDRRNSRPRTSCAVGAQIPGLL